MKKLRLLFVASLVGLAFFGMAVTANAVTILDTTFSTNGSYTLGNFSLDQDPLGQSFTLNQNVNNLMIGGMIRDVNDFLAPDLSITISLVSGAGTGGTLLGSLTTILFDGFSGLHTEDFSSLGTIGVGIYTAVFSSGATGRGGLMTTGIDDPNSDPYNENGIFPFSSPSGQRVDFAVRVSGDPAPVPVPEPTTLTLMGLGLIAGFAFSRRRKAH